jgi:transposase
MFPPIAPTELTKKQRSTLESWVRSPTMQSRAVQRARIVLAAGKGISNRQIAKDLGITRTTVILWRTRFAEGGTDALAQDAPRC